MLYFALKRVGYYLCAQQRWLRSQLSTIAEKLCAGAHSEGSGHLDRQCISEKHGEKWKQRDDTA
jgi:hypothetical protein